MKLNIWHLVFFSFVCCFQVAVSQPRDNGHRESSSVIDDIDKQAYFCGEKLSNMLSKYCLGYFPPMRRKRGISGSCCGGLGCTIRYAVTNYCRMIKPEFKELFLTTPEIYSTPKSPKINSEETDILQKPKIESRPLYLNKIQKHIHDGKLSQENSDNNQPVVKILNNKTKQVRNSNKFRSFRRSFRIVNSHSNQLCKCTCRLNRYNRQSERTTESTSYIGTDHVPNGTPIYARTKYHFKF